MSETISILRLHTAKCGVLNTGLSSLLHAYKPLFCCHSGGKSVQINWASTSFFFLSFFFGGGVFELTCETFLFSIPFTYTTHSLF